MPDTTPRAGNSGDVPHPEQGVPPQRKRRTWLIVPVVLLALAVLIFIRLHGGKQKPAAPPPPVSIGTVTARKGDIGVYVNGLGSVTPVRTVTLTSQVGGQIVKVNYEEGQLVEVGTPLIEIDPRSFEAQLMAAEGQLERDKAVLEEAQMDLERYEAASASNAIPKQQLDDQRAVVHQNQGTVKYDQGQVNNVTVQLGYCHITSPIAGRVGLRLVDLGNVVMASPGTPLVSITQLQPITVIFSVAEDYVPEIQLQLAQGHHMEVEAYDRAQEKKIATGEFLALDNLIDTNTGSIRVRSIFTNQNHALFPNQFVNARLLVETIHDATLLPASVVQRNAQTAFVYVVQQEETNQVVEMRTVKVGVTDGNTNAVEGVKPGEVIAASNFNRLQDKAKISVRKPGENAGQRSGP